MFHTAGQDVNPGSSSRECSTKTLLQFAAFINPVTSWDLRKWTIVIKQLSSDHFQVLSLTLDGITGGVQDRMRSSHVTQTHRMMFYMNMWSALYLAVGECHCRDITH